jgi:hypothetical protein
MRLIVHLGLHKTASTNLQHLLHAHRAAVCSRGVFYQASSTSAAHHEVAWRLLGGDPTLLDAMLAEARRQECEDIILSSEDLEGLFFNPAPARLIQESAQRAGASVEWHAVLRKPDAYFSSLYAQLQCHVYADALTMFAEIMNKGGLYMHNPAPNWGGTPFWYYSFDHARDLDVFARATGQHVFAHDYADDQPFPGWRLLQRLGVLDLITQLPDEVGQNRRHPADVVLAGYRARIAEAGGGTLKRHVDAAVAVSMASVPHCAQLINERFADSHAQALNRFGGK